MRLGFGASWASSLVSMVFVAMMVACASTNLGATRYVALHSDGYT